MGTLMENNADSFKVKNLEIERLNGKNLQTSHMHQVLYFDRTTTDNITECYGVKMGYTETVTDSGEKKDDYHLFPCEITLTEDDNGNKSYSSTSAINDKISLGTANYKFHNIYGHNLNLTGATELYSLTASENVYLTDSNKNNKVWIRQVTRSDNPMWETKIYQGYLEVRQYPAIVNTANSYALKVEGGASYFSSVGMFAGGIRNNYLYMGYNAIELYDENVHFLTYKYNDNYKYIHRKTYIGTNGRILLGSYLPSGKTSPEYNVYIFGDNTDMTKNSIWTKTRVSASECVNHSDKRLKNFCEFLSKKESLTLLKQIKPLKFSWKDDINNIKHYGLFAQDLRDILLQNEIENCSLVHINSFDKNLSTTDLLTPETDDIEYGINYAALVNPLIVGWQAHEQEIQELKAKNAELEAKLNSLLN